jgi:hypothetical protein
MEGTVKRISFIILLLGACNGEESSAPVPEAREKAQKEMEGKIQTTNAMLEILRKACITYRTDHGRDWYPPTRRFGQGKSSNLHLYLGRDRHAGYSSRIKGMSSKRHGYVNFPSKWLKGNPGFTYPVSTYVYEIIDSWGNPISYENPGPNNPAPSFRIRSKGPDGKESEDDIVVEEKGF